jgi:protein involved in polysaccharide export with SLBB domain
MRLRLLLSCLLLLPIGADGAAAAQQPDTAALRRQVEARLGTPVSHQDVIDRLRQSGLSRQEIRARLAALGYDPSMADRYLDAMEGAGPQPGSGPASEQMTVALRQIGLSIDAAARDAFDRNGARTADSSGVAPAGADAGGIELFGRALFRRATSEFQPVLTGPVDRDYRVGPGDEMVLVFTGDLEFVYNLTVSREGAIVVPDVGQVVVNGTTLQELEDRLITRLSRVYSSVSRGAGATTQVQVSLGRLRTNLVYVMGEVERPGAYQVSAVSTAFHALYQAGGPAQRGGFRQVEVRRGGNVLRHIDLYDYLLRGDSRGDIRLEQGDIIFVPAGGARVRVEGAVRRPAIFDLQPSDDLGSVLMYAAGFDAEAFIRTLQIDRILPAADRRDGVNRVLIDVPLEQLLAADRPRIPLHDGDVVRVFALPDELRHRVTLVGSVRRPGVYDWSEGRTFLQVLERADGLDERAYTPRAHVYRLNGTDGSRRLIPVALQDPAGFDGLRDFLLEDRDSIVIHDRQNLRLQEVVSIDGYVRNPGRYIFSDSMTLEDLILAAGGFAEGADLSEVEIARMPLDGRRTDTTAVVVRVPLRASRLGNALGSSPAAAWAGTTIPDWMPAADEFALRHRDHVSVRRSTGFELPSQVMVVGEVERPGAYVLRQRSERLTDLLSRTGGVTAEGYLDGIRLVRGGTLLATDVRRALRDPAGRFNLLLEGGDSLHVPRYDPTVLVTGAVAFESRILYKPGEPLDYYIRQAGGYRANAARDEVSITFPDGSRAITGRTVLFRRSPGIRPGSTVLVPEREDSPGVDWNMVFTRTLAVASSAATLLLAIQQLR